MIVALNKAINAAIGNQFQDRTVTKSYTAVLYGHLQEDTGSMDFPIGKGEFPLQKVCYETGKKALTDYRVIERNEEEGKLTTRVEFNPMTGRTHQLRVHSEAFGYPILGCDLYASDEAFFMANRLMLHATTIEFDHPVSGKRIYGGSPCPF